MRKYLHLLLLSLLGIAAQAQTTPAITLTVEVDGNTRTLELATTEGVQKFQIDWGDGKLVETEEIGPNPDGWSWTDVTGTPVGGGEIKIYGGNIGYFACSSRVDGAQVTSLDVTNAPDLTDLTVNTNKLSALDLSHNAKLATLVCGNNPLTQLNLSANTALTSLDGNDLQLTSIDLTHNTALTSLKLNNSKLTQIDLSKNTELTQIYLLGNQLTQIDLSYNDKLTYASLNNNQLTSLDVTGCDALKSLLCMNNQLTELKTNDLTGTVTINGNYLTPATLPVVSGRYTYAPQNPMQIEETVQTGQAIDLSAQDNLTGLAGAPQKTTFTWTTESGTVLVAGTDYTEDGGKFTFLKPQAEPVYCTMETKAFEKFSGTNAFKTTAVKVADGSTTGTPAITLTVEVDGNTRTLELATTEGVQKFQIDWGDGKLVETEEIGPNPDGWSWTDVTGTPVGGGEIKIYGGNIGYFACSSRVDGAQVTSLDVTNAPDLTDLTVNTNKLSALDLSQNTKLATLVCGNNPLTQLDLSANTVLTSLDGNDLQLTSIDLTHNTALTSLKLNNSELTQIDLSKNTELTQIYLLGNQLTQIDLSYNDKLTYASLNNNQLTSLDVTGCDALKSLLCMNNQLTELKTNDLTGTVTINGNYLTPATLPVVSASRYNYAPQNPMQIGETVQTGQAIDLSEQDNLTGLADAPQKTTFTWTTESGTVLEAGTDYTEDGGKFTFLKPQAEPVYCTMETEAFPSFSGTNAFKTTMVKVNGPDGVKGIGATTLAISGGKGTISVAGMAAGSTVEVYDLSGRKVAAQTAMGSRVTFNVKAGLYIVSVNGTARKVNAF